MKRLEPNKKQVAELRFLEIMYSGAVNLMLELIKENKALIDEIQLNYT